MNIIIPMAGMGTRMRPHTLTVPKPLIHLAGKSIVHHLVEDIANVVGEEINEIAFVIGNFGEKVEKQLSKIAESVGAKAKIYYQTEALGTAHAVWCAAASINDKTIVAFADTLFFADFKISEKADSVIWVQKVENPEQYGVVTTNENNVITGFEEKPKSFVSDLAIIGIYYFKNGLILKDELQNIINNKITKSGEYQFTTALENLRNKGLVFVPGEVEEWLDCGNKNLTIQTHQRILTKKTDAKHIAKNAIINNSVIIQPCYIGKNTTINNSVVGPYISIGENSIINNSVVKNSIIQCNSEVDNVCIENSMLGSNSKISRNAIEFSIGDYNVLEIK